MWAKTSTLSGSYCAFSYGTNSTSKAMFIGQSGSDLLVGGYNNDISVPNFWTQDEWHHVCLTYDGTTAKVYGDGIELASESKAWNLVLLRAFIARNVNGQIYWQGLTDDVRVYDYALTATEVRAIMGASFISAPSALSATAVSSSQINLSWTDNSDNETGFQIERATSENGTYSLIHTTAANVTTYQNAGLSSGTPYYYRIRATNASGNSGYSNKANAATIAIPTAPSNLVATATSTSSITLNWTDNSGNETGFQIERATSENGTYSLIHTTAANVTTYQNTGLSSGTRYYYRIRATHASGNSGYSNKANATTIAIPAAPSNLIATATSTSSITLTWTDNSSNETGFEIQRSENATSGFVVIHTTGANVSTYVNSGLTATTVYYYRIRTINGSSAASAFIVGSATTLPFAPGCVLAKRVSSAAIEISWADTNIGEDGYEIERSKNNSFELIHTTSPNATTFTDNAVAAGTSYTYQVRAVKGNAKSDLTASNVVGTGSLEQDIMNQYAFQYKYDERNRMIEKKVPGADWVYMVYDNRDRLVLTQDGNQRSKKGSNCANQSEWTFTKYDALNRPVLTGIYITNSNRETLQTAVNDFYAAAENNPDKWFEVRGGAFHGYTSQSFPDDADVSNYLTATYYDDDSYQTLLPGGSTNFLYSACEIPDAEAPQLYKQYSYSGTTCQNKISFPRLKGMVTATKTRVLGEGATQWLWSINHYDDKGRVVQNISTNSLYQLDRTTMIYDFVGKVLYTKTVHNVGQTNTKTIARKFDYDHAGRLLKTWHRIDENGDFILLSENDYNELGQLVTKKLHSEDNGTTFKQNVDYRFNIRGWLTRINRADLTPDDPNETRDFFGMEFGYNNDLGIGSFTPQYNGNISATKWSANLGLALPYLNEPTERAYKFTYDPMNRLREANYAGKAGSWTPSLAYREAMDYDLNGNILSLHRNNAKGATMDWLEYNYGTGGNKSNQLKSVTDYGILTKGFRDGNTSVDDYAYDGNGNLVLDKNKEISVIKYNSLNVTEQIDKSTGEKVKYIYDADGIKLTEEIYLAGAQTPVKRIDYVGPLVYENDTLKFIVHEEGKIVIPKDEFGPEYQYQIKDHLGNIRLTFTTKEKTEVFKATMEDTGIADYNNPRVQEMQHFGNLFETEIRNVNQWLNHTSNSIGNAIYLDGSENKTIGPYTMLKVYPGDTVKIEVFAKFEKKSSHSTMPLVDLLVALATPVQTAAIGFEGGGAWSSSSFFEGLLPFLGNRSSSSTVPAAYLNYILFDKDFKVVDLGFDRIDGSGGFNPAQENTVAFDKLELQRIIDRVGYIYVYVSNESEGTRVWMDDVKITYGQSPIVQFEDYYPFGLSQAETAFQRGNDKYTGMFTTDGTGLKDLGFRQYDAVLGRFHAVDPLAELQDDQSTYQYAGNNPVNQIDVLGLEAEDHDKEKDKPKPPKRDKHKKEQRVKEKEGYSRYKPDRRNDRQRGNNTQTARSRREKSNSSGTSARKKKDTGGNNASASKNSGNKNESGSSDPDPAQQALINMLVSGPPLNNGRDKSERRDDPTDVFNNQNDNNRKPRFENSVTPPQIEDDIETGTPSVAQSAALGQTTTDIEQYRQHVIRNHYEWRALYARMLVERNYNYQSNRRKENIDAVNNTSTSEDKILDQRPQDPPPTSTPAEALAKIQEKEGTLAVNSEHFPNVSRQEFLDQLKARVSEGGHEQTNQGAGTNFCWAAAIAKEAYERDPEGMADAMIGLYKNGTFVYDNNNGGMNVPKASQAARNAVGSTIFDNNQDEEKGRTINELDQMLFMTLADHYEESLNILNQDYDPGDEEEIWASGVLSKATRIWEDFGFDVEVTGADVKVQGFTIVFNVFDVQEAIETNDVVLYVNSDKFKYDEGLNATATHYIHVESIAQAGGKYEITYWDYGAIHQVTMDATQFSSAVYGMIEIPRTND